MIVVLADDLAGAAEMGGMAWRHGLSAEVRTGAGLDFAKDRPSGSAEVVVLDTNTRSCAPAEAARRVFEVAVQCRGWGVRGVYKKVDSVLRGPVAAELGALLDALGFELGLLVPANPGLGRVISNGQYLVEGVPLHETGFRLDPEYPATTADVLERVERSGWAVPGRATSRTLCLRSPGEALPERGLVVGEAANGADLAAWAALSVRPDLLAAGASEFFGAYLGALGHPPGAGFPEDTLGRETRALFVCGSTSAGSRAFCRRSEARGVPLLRVPCDLLRQPVEAPQVAALVERWADEVVRALLRSGSAIVAIDRPLCSEPGMPQMLGEYLSEVAARVLSLVEVGRLFVEGGATAVSVVCRMGWTCFDVRREWATGVVSLEVRGQQAPLISIKPGSYAWPDALVA